MLVTHWSIIFTSTHLPGESKHARNYTSTHLPGESKHAPGLDDRDRACGAHVSAGPPSGRN